MLASVKRRCIKGVTLVEVMVTVAIVGIIASIAVPSFTEMLNSRRVQVIAAEISSDLALARAETALRSQAVAVYFGENAEMSCYSIAYFGNLGSCDCTRGEGLRCTSEVKEFKTNQIPKRLGVTAAAAGTWNPPFAVGVVSFEAPRMTASVPDLEVNVAGSRAQLKIKLNGMGRISTCSPNGSMSGVATCAN